MSTDTTVKLAEFIANINLEYDSVLEMMIAVGVNASPGMVELRTSQYDDILLHVRNLKEALDLAYEPDFVMGEDGDYWLEDPRDVFEDYRPLNEGEPPMAARLMTMTLGPYQYYMITSAEENGIESSKINLEQYEAVIKASTEYWEKEQKGIVLDEEALEDTPEEMRQTDIEELIDAASIPDAAEDEAPTTEGYDVEETFVGEGPDFEDGKIDGITEDNLLDSDEIVSGKWDLTNDEEKQE